ncbi:MAG: hypothetical protein SNG38_04415 [Rikenellaceae bacterium]
MDSILDTLQSPPTFDVLNKIVEQTHSVVDNTTPNFWWDDVSFIAFASLLFTVVGLYSIFHESRREKIDKDCQQHIFIDMLRHFYRNKICSITMMLKYKEAMMATPRRFCYPSDEHYLKLMVLPDDLHLERFYKEKKRFDLLHNLHLLMRNYNIEIETSLLHIKQTDVDQVTKYRDFNTLNMKSGLITLKIVETMGVLWSRTKPLNILWDQIEKAHSENLRRNPMPVDVNDAKLKKAEAIIDDFIELSIANGDNYLALFKNYDKSRQEEFKKILRDDLLIEFFNDSKIHIIYTV